jgi:collagenase-like PrtC family protease
MHTRSLELLSPARDCATGKAAIDHGADAVYIGAPRFGARAAAANSIDEIRQLADYAHRFYARVYVAFNTLLNDSEVEEAVALTHALYAGGVDALIIQDMGLLDCDLPPIPLHASTQCDNRTPEKVRFLEGTGFSQVVLARELNLEQIREIRRATSVPLEFFVHGALCVSFSGRCLISEKVAGRSANRGCCAQFCRHRYTLKDTHGNTLKKDSHLLSLMDLNLSGHLQQLIDAGIDSFKIEGRLKDISYVKNVTAFYRTALDRIIDVDAGLRRSSSGRCTFGFQPDPQRTFNRGGTDYFLTLPRNRPGALKTPKSIGEEIGRVGKISPQYFELEKPCEIANGDGLCFFDTNDTLIGLRVNKVECGRIYVRNSHLLGRGTTIFRNFDSAFIRQLKKSENCRKIAVDIILSATAEGLNCTIYDEDDCRTAITTPGNGEQSRDPDRMRDILIKQLKKSGNTDYIVRSVILNLGQIPHIPVAAINDIRRRAFDAHRENRLRQHVIPAKLPVDASLPWPKGLAAPPDQTNAHARAFYARHGLELSATGESHLQNATTLMTSKYCIKAQLGLCPTSGARGPFPAEPLTIADNTGTYTLAFDCRTCEMRVLTRTCGERR